MKRKFLSSYQSTTFDGFSKHTNFHSLTVTLDGIENEKQIPLAIFNSIYADEKEKKCFIHLFTRCSANQLLGNRINHK